MSIYVGVPEVLLYTPLSYIDTSGTQKINTGYYPNTNTRLELNFRLLGSSVTIDYEKVYEASDYYRLIRNDRQNRFIFTVGSGPNAGTIPLSQETDYNLVVCKDYIKYNEDIRNFATPSSFSYNYQLELAHGNDRYSKIRIYSAKIYENDVLVRDYIPVLDSNNVACLFDRVNNTFYYNQGTGTFIAGTPGTPVYVDSKARKITKAYIGINGVAQKITKAYVGVNGVAEEIQIATDEDSDVT